jgi:SAM-dependent methyltransferase
VTGSFTQHTEAAHRAYFNQQQRSNLEFWGRFGAAPDVRGKRVLDFGCGHGALSAELARQGAEVLGIDLDELRLEWASGNVGGLADFALMDIAEVTGRFDLIVSKDTLEHVEDVEEILRHFHRLITPDGAAWIGFSPLYRSPWGDHGRTGLRIPWSHAVLPPRLVLAAASRHQQRPITSLPDLELNGVTPDEFRRSVDAAGLSVAQIRFNQGDRAMLRVFDRLRRIPALEPLFTVSIYAVLRPGSSAAEGRSGPAHAARDPATHLRAPGR